MYIKHPIHLGSVLLLTAVAIWPKILGQLPKQNPTTLRIALIVLAAADFALWYFVP